MFGDDVWRQAGEPGLDVKVDLEPDDREVVVSPCLGDKGASECVLDGGEQADPVPEFRDVKGCSLHADGNVPDVLTGDVEWG
jgi:hypothetical protein